RTGGVPREHARLARTRRPARRARRRPVRAVPVGGGAPAARTAPPHRPCGRARATPAARTRDGTTRVTRLTMRRAMRLFGSLLIVAGVLTLGWAVLVWQWQDAFTAAYT